MWMLFSPFVVLCSYIYIINNYTEESNSNMRLDYWNIYMFKRGVVKKVKNSSRIIGNYVGLILVNKI